MKLKKILALVLVFCMCLSMFPTYAFADDEGIYVEEDYEEPAIVEVPEEVVEEETPVEPVEEELPAAETEEEIPEEVADPVEEEPSEEPEEELTLTLEDEELFDEAFEGIAITEIATEAPKAVAYVAYDKIAGFCMAYDDLKEAVAAAGTGERMYVLGTTVTVIKPIEGLQQLTAAADLAEGTFVTVTAANSNAVLYGNFTLDDGIELKDIAVVGSITVPADAQVALSNVNVTGFTDTGLTVEGAVIANGLTMSGNGNRAIDVYLDGADAVFTTADANLGNIMSIVVNAGTLNVSGGTYRNILLDDHPEGPVVGNVTGGKAESVDDALFEEYHDLGTDGVATATDIYVAYIGEGAERVRYKEFDKAVAAGNNGAKTIVLLKSVNYNLPQNTTMKLQETDSIKWSGNAEGELTTTTNSTDPKVTTYSTSAKVVTLSTGSDLVYYTTLADAFEAMAANKTATNFTIKLVDNYSEILYIASDDELEVPNDKIVVLDLGGHFGENAVVAETGIAVRGELTVKNGVLKGNENTVAFRDNAVFYVTGKLTLASNTDITTTDTAIQADGASTVTLTDGAKLNAETAIVSAGTVSLSDCKISGKVSATGSLTVNDETVIMGAVEIGSDASFTASGVATFTDVVAADKADTVSISKGSFEKAVTISGTDAVAISGGVFQDNVTVDAKGAGNNITGGTFLKTLEIKGTGNVTVATGTQLSATVNNATVAGKLAVTGSGNVEIGAVAFPTAFEPEGSGKVTVTGATFNETVTVKGEQAAEFVNCTFKQAVAFAGSGEITVSGGSFAEAVSVTGTSAVTVKGAAAFAKTVTVNSSASGFAVQKDGEDEPSFTGEVTINIADTDNIKVGAGKFYGQGRYVKELNKDWLPDNTYNSKYENTYIHVVRTDVIASYTDLNGNLIECYNNEELNGAITTGTPTTLTIAKAAPEAIEFVLEAGQSLKVVSAVPYSIKAKDNRTQLSGVNADGKVPVLTTSEQIDYANVVANEKETTWTAVPYIATVGSERFLVLKDALDAANNGVVHTVTLWHDVELATETTIYSGITIEGENNTIDTGAYAVKLTKDAVLKDAIVKTAAGIEIVADSTLQNVTVDGAAKGITVNKSATLTAIGTLGIELPAGADTAIYLTDKTSKLNLTQCNMIVIGAPKVTNMPSVITTDTAVDAFTLRYNGVDGVETVRVMGAAHDNDGYEVINSGKITGTSTAAPVYPYVVTIDEDVTYYSDFATATDLAKLTDNKDNKTLTLNKAFADGDIIVLDAGEAIIINLNGKMSAQTVKNSHIQAKQSINDVGEPALVEDTVDTYKFGVVDNVATVYWTSEAISGTRVVSRVFDNLEEALNAALVEHVNEYPYVKLNRVLKDSETIKITANDALAFYQEAGAANNITEDAKNVKVYSDAGLVSTRFETRSGNEALVFFVSNEDAVFSVGGRLYTENQSDAAFKKALASNTDVQILKAPKDNVTYTVPEKFATEDFSLSIKTDNFVGTGAYTEASFKAAKAEALAKFTVEPIGTSTDLMPHFVKETTPANEQTYRSFELVDPVAAAVKGDTVRFYRTAEAAVQDSRVTHDTETVLYVMPGTTVATFELKNGESLTLANTVYGDKNTAIGEGIKVALADQGAKTFFSVEGEENTAKTAKTWKVGVLMATVTVGETTKGFASLQEAFDYAAQQTEATLTLNKDYEGSFTATDTDLPTEVTGNITINLNGRKLAVSADIPVAGQKTLTVVNGGLNFAEDKGFEVSGALVLGAENSELTVTGSVAPVIDATAGSSVSIVNATIATASATSLIKAHGATVVITGAKLNNPDGTLIDAAQSSENNNFDVTINSGRFDAKAVIATVTDLDKLVIKGGSFNKNAVYFNDLTSSGKSGERTLGVFVPYGMTVVENNDRFVVEPVNGTATYITSSKTATHTDAAKHELSFNADSYAIESTSTGNVVFDFEIHAPAQVTKDNIDKVTTPKDLPANVSFVELATSTDADAHYVYKYQLVASQTDLENALEKEEIVKEIKAELSFKWNKSAEDDTFSVTIPTENFTATGTDIPYFQSEDGVMTWKNGEEVIARIGKVGYTSLFAAMSAVDPDGTIKLIKDYVATGTDAMGLNGNTLVPTDADTATGFIGKNFTLDLGDHTLTPAAAIALGTTTDVKYTIKNGAIDLSKALNGQAPIKVGYGGIEGKTTLNVENIKLVGTPTTLNDAILAVQDKATVTVKGTNIASVAVRNGGELYVANGEFESIEANDGTVLIKDGTVAELKAIDSKVGMFGGTVATLTSLKSATATGTPTDIVIQGGKITDLFNGDVASATDIGGKVTVAGSEIANLYTNINTVAIYGGDVEQLVYNANVAQVDNAFANVINGRIGKIYATGTDAAPKPNEAQLTVAGSAAVGEIGIGANAFIGVISGSVDVIRNIGGNAQILGGNIGRIEQLATGTSLTLFDNIADKEPPATPTEILSSPTVGSVALGSGQMAISGGTFEGGIDVTGGKLQIGAKENNFIDGEYKSAFAPNILGQLSYATPTDVTVVGGRFANEVPEEIVGTGLYPTTNDNELFGDGMYHVYTKVTLTLLPNGTPESPVTLTVDGDVVKPYGKDVTVFATGTDAVAYNRAAGDVFGYEVLAEREGFDTAKWYDDLASDTDIGAVKDYRVATDTTLEVKWTAQTMTVKFTSGDAYDYKDTTVIVENVPVGTDLASYTDLAGKVRNLFDEAMTAIAPKNKILATATDWVVEETGEKMTILHGEGNTTVTFVPVWKGSYTINFTVGLERLNASITGNAGDPIPASYGSWLAIEADGSVTATYKREGIDSELSKYDLEQGRKMYALDDLYDEGKDSYITESIEKALVMYDKIKFDFVTSTTEAGQTYATRYVAAGHTLQGSLDALALATPTNSVRKAYFNNYKQVDDPTDKPYFKGWTVKGAESDKIWTTQEIWEYATNTNMTFVAVYDDSKDYKVTVNYIDANGVQVATTTELSDGTIRREVDNWVDTVVNEAGQSESTVYTLREVAPVKEFDRLGEDVTYTAVYDEAVRTYKVKFMNGDVEMQVKDVPYNTTPVYTGKTPTKDADETYTYTFVGWLATDTDITTATDLKLEKVTADTTYKAQYSTKNVKYTIEFRSEDGQTLLESYELNYGDMPVATSTDVNRPEYLTKPETAQYSYTWDGWTPAIATVTDAAVYKVKFQEHVKEYSVTFFDEDGTSVLATVTDLPYGTDHLADLVDEPTKESTEIYDFSFDRWVVATGTDAGTALATDTKLTGDASYKAVFEGKLRNYTVTFKNYDDSVLGSYTATATDLVHKPDIMTEPTKPQDAQYTYTFATWTNVNGTPTDITKVKVTGDLTFIATYTELIRHYKVRFLDGDNTTVLATIDSIDFGDTPIFSSAKKPTKASDAQYTYTWDTQNPWTPAIAKIATDTDYTPNFTATARKYKVTWAIGTSSTTVEVAYGEMPAYTGEGEYEWLPAIKPVDGDITYTAQLEAQKWIVTFESNGGTDVEPIEVENGKLARAPETAPTNGKYSLDGWFLVKQDGTIESEPFDFDTERVTEDITLRAKWSWVDTVSVGKALNIRDNIGINLRIKNLLDEPENYSIVATFAGKTVIDGNLAELVSSGAAGMDGTTVVIPAVFVKSVEMKEKLEYTITHVPSDTKVVDNQSYSVQQYCINKITASNTDPKLVAVCYSMLNYGSRAQLYFPYKEDDLAYTTDNGNYSEDYSALVIPESYAAPSDPSVCTGISSVGKALDMDSAMALRFYFRPNGTNISQYSFSAKVNGETVEIEPVVNSDGRFLVVISGIAASDFDDVYTVTITNKEDQSSKTVSYSVMAYAYAKQSGSAKLAEVCKAIYQYHLDAKAYFG